MLAAKRTGAATINGQAAQTNLHASSQEGGSSYTEVSDNGSSRCRGAEGAEGQRRRKTKLLRGRGAEGQKRRRRRGAEAQRHRGEEGAKGAEAQRRSGAEGGFRV